MSRTSRVTLLCVLLAAAFLRLFHLEHGLGFHPDERHMVMVTQALEENGFNPKSFAYGSIPYYLLWLMAKLGAWSNLVAWSYDSIFIVGRTLAAAVGVLTVALTYRVARRLELSEKMSALASALLALNVLHFQLSRFFTVDVFLTLTTLWAVDLLLQWSKTRKSSTLLLIGVAWGVSLAVKTSALALLAPVLGTVWCIEKGLKDKALTFLKIVGVALLTFAVGEPFALLDFATFMAQNAEQGAMVTGKWIPPYAIQYIGTEPWSYHLHQFVEYTGGRLLLVFTIIGLLRAATKKSISPWILLFWVLPFFFVYGGMRIKYPRYLLPLYPGVMIFAVMGLSALASVSQLLKKTLILVLGVVTLLRCLAFVSIYQQDHVWVQASQWIGRNIPAGSILLNEHWDDLLPLRVPELPRAGYQMGKEDTVLPLYEPDQPGKFQSISQRLSRGDYIVLSTARLYGSIPQDPERYALSIRYYDLLFSGQLGYRLLKTFKVEPSFWAWSYPDELADESLSVYDHPRVVIFKNEAHLSPESIFHRVMSTPERDPKELRLKWMTQKEAGYLESSRSSSWIWSGLTWLIWIEILSWLAFPVLFVLLPQVADRGLGMSRIFGVFFWAFIAWGMTHFLEYDYSRSTLIQAAFAVAGVSLIAGVNRWGQLWEWLKEHRRELAVQCALYFIVFGFFLFLRALQPEIFWGEKPMDFSFLNYFARAQSMPPQEPWASEFPMRYYYFGFFILGAFHKITLISTPYGYQLGLAMFGAFLVLALRSVLALQNQYSGQRMAWATVGAILIALGSNLETLHQWVLKHGVYAFDQFWSSSRVFTSPAFSEYPVWSQLFADLHAHVMAGPWVVFLVFIALVLFYFSSGVSLYSRAILSVILGSGLGILFMTNSWDLITLALTLGVMFWMSRKHAWGMAVIVAVSAAVVMSPVLKLLQSGIRPHWGMTLEGFNTAAQMGWYFGFFIAAALASALASLVESCEIRIDLKAALIAGIILSVSVWMGSVWRVVIPCAFFSIWMMLRARLFFRQRLDAVPALLLAALLLVVCAERFTFMDRMNTIFKVYIPVWLLLGLGLWAWLPRAWGPRWSKVIASLWVVLSLTGTYLNVYAMAKERKVPGPRPSLDGVAYLERTNPEEAEIFRWLREEVAGTPVLIEAAGDSYGNYARAVMNTGIPIVQGWEYHTWQRGVPERETNKRKEAIRLFYETDSPDEALVILKSYSVDFFLVGDLERKTYRGSGFKKFDENPQLFPVVLRVGGTTLYGSPFTSWLKTLGIPADLGTTPVRAAPPMVRKVGLFETRFKAPRGIAIDSEGKVYVVEQGANQIHVFGMDGRWERSFGTGGSGPGELNQPTGVTVGSDDRVYVADTWNHRIQVFARDGKFTQEIRLAFFGPRDFLQSNQGEWILSDTGHHHLVVLSSDFKPLRAIGRRGGQAGEFQNPIGLAQAGSTILVADSGNARIQLIDRKTGTMIRSIDMPGWKEARVVEPYLSWISGRRFVTMNTTTNELMVFDQSGKLNQVVQVTDGPVQYWSGLACFMIRNRSVCYISGSEQVYRVEL